MDFITDRTREDVLRRNALALKGRSGMTADELSDWYGHPMSKVGSNLFPPGPYYASSVTLEYLGDTIIVRGLDMELVVGQWTHAVSIIGEAFFYEGQTLTLSVDSASGTGKAQIAFYWHDSNGSEYAGGRLIGAGSTTFALTANTNNRTYLAAYVYLLTFQTQPISPSLYTEYHGVRLTRGTEQHEYVPYVELVPTSATKGAYNYFDLNRVEKAVAVISDALGLGLTTKTDWAMWDVPRESDMKRYVNNVRVIRNVAGINIALPEVGDKLTFRDANNIESILSNALAATESELRCGDVFCGDL